MNSRDEVILRKMLDYCAQIERTHAFFQNDEALFLRESDGFVYRNSIAMPILQIGELAKRLSEDYIAANGTIPWRAIMGIRDVFAYHYGSVDFGELWQTSHADIDILKAFIAAAL